MLLVLIATITIGAGVGGLVLGLGRLLGGQIPRWVAPVAGGLAMFAFMLWNEYSWYGRAQAVLAPEARIAQTRLYASWVQPWTLAVPRVAGFVSVSLSDAAPYADRPALSFGVVTVHGRLEDPQQIAHLFDCRASRRAAIDATPPADPETASWVDAGPDDPLIRAACNETTD